MDKSILNTLTPGEKILDVKELYLGKNGSILTYEVTLYTCKRFLFTKHISKYKYPFYFDSKELINEFFKHIDKFYIKHGGNCGGRNSYQICLNTASKNYEFYMCSAFCDYDWQLRDGQIWNGKLCGFYECEHKASYKSYTFNMDELFKLEHESSKENTYGETYLYKLQQI